MSHTTCYRVNLSRYSADMDLVDLNARAARSRDAALTAARALLDEEGPAAVTHQRVAKRAGVGRATVYRHWPQPETLLQDAIAGVDLPFFALVPDRIDDPAVRAAWLHRELRLLADELALPTVARITATLVQSAQRDPAARRRLDQWLDKIDQRLGAAGVGTGASDTAALLIGPLVYRAVLQAAPVGDALIDRLVSAALYAPGPAAD